MCYFFEFILSSNKNKNLFALMTATSELKSTDVQDNETRILKECLYEKTFSFVAGSVLSFLGGLATARKTSPNAEWLFRAGVIVGSLSDRGGLSWFVIWCSPQGHLQLTGAGKQSHCKKVLYT